METGSNVTASATTHSFEPPDFPETAKWPAIGGHAGRRSGPSGDRFLHYGHFGQVVSSHKNPVPGGSINISGWINGYGSKDQAPFFDESTPRVNRASASLQSCVGVAYQSPP